MHKLDRPSVPRPSCLEPTDPPRRFNTLHGREKEAIRAQLVAMQGQCCAYCERRTGTHQADGHIEHLRNQAGHQHLETDWDNLFWSCSDERSCGKHKDKCSIVGGTDKCRSFNPDHIINPCNDDPDDFMIFVTDGNIRPHANLSADNLNRFHETLRVFQLADSAFLRKSREDAVAPYIGALNALRAARVSSDLIRIYIDGEISQLASRPFATAIRHFLTSNRP